MGTEIERKFLVRSDRWQPDPATGMRYRQGYLANTEGSTVRIRIAGEMGFVTVKGPTAGISRLEFEYRIPLVDAAEMLGQLCAHPLIEKVRYRVPWAGLTWEVDVFEGDNAGLIVAEIELPSADARFDRPPWLGEEVSHDPRYFNAALTRNPWSRWAEAVLTIASPLPLPGCRLLSPGTDAPIRSPTRLVPPPTMVPHEDCCVQSQSPSHRPARRGAPASASLGRLPAQQMTTETRDPKQTQDAEPSRSTTRSGLPQPKYGTPLVDHLPLVHGIPTPKDVLGYYIGAPRKLTYYADQLKYYRALAAATPRVKVETIGKSDEGRELVVVWVSSDANMQKLAAEPRQPRQARRSAGPERRADHSS